MGSRRTNKTDNRKHKYAVLVSRHQGGSVKPLAKQRLEHEEEAEEVQIDKDTTIPSQPIVTHKTEEDVAVHVEDQSDRPTELENMNVKQLREIARTHNIKGGRVMTKADLIYRICEAEGI